MGTYRSLLSACIVACILAITRVEGASTYQLVSSDASCRSGRPLRNFLSQKDDEVGDNGDVYTVVGVVDLCTESSTATINRIFDTNFKADNDGIALELSKEKAVLFSTFDSMFSANFCGCKAAEYMGLIPDTICILVPEIDLQETLDAHDQLFRRLLAKLNTKNLDHPVPLVIMVRSSDMMEDGTLDHISQYLQSVWKDINDMSDMKRVVEVAILSIDRSSDSSILSDFRTPPPSVDKGALVELITSSGKFISTGFPKAFLKPDQRSALFAIESTYTKCLANAEAVMQRWVLRVNNGKVIGKFGERVQQLIFSIQRSFNAGTAGSLLVRERASRAEQLSASIVGTALSLFKQQVTVLQNEASESMKEALIKLTRIHNQIPSEEEQQAMRTVFSNFQIAANELESEALGFTSTDAQNELRTTLKTLLENFPESPAAKLEAVRKFDYKSRQSQRKKDRGINVGLNLVGMLRPPGNGGLQGFVGYSTGLFGLPLDLLLGFHNDGDSPEIIGDDREYPILRLQPKVSFDVSV